METVHIIAMKAEPALWLSGYRGLLCHHVTEATIQDVHPDGTVCVASGDFPDIVFVLPRTCCYTDRANALERAIGDLCDFAAGDFAPLLAYPDIRLALQRRYQALVAGDVVSEGASRRALGVGLVL